MDYYSEVGFNHFPLRYDLEFIGDLNGDGKMEVIVGHFSLGRQRGDCLRGRWRRGGGRADGALLKSGLDWPTKYACVNRSEPVAHYLTVKQGPIARCSFGVIKPDTSAGLHVVHS